MLDRVAISWMSQRYTMYQYPEHYNAEEEWENAGIGKVLNPERQDEGGDNKREKPEEHGKPD